MSLSSYAAYAPLVSSTTKLVAIYLNDNEHSHFPTKVYVTVCVWLSVDELGYLFIFIHADSLGHLSPWKGYDVLCYKWNYLEYTECFVKKSQRN